MTQRGPSRYPTTARMKWTKEVNKLVIKCFYKSDPNQRGYRKRMINIWKEIGVFDITEQRLADQSRAIRTNGWLSEMEMEEIQREIEREMHIDEDTEGAHMENDLENSGEDINMDATGEDATDDEINMAMVLARLIENEVSKERKSLLQELAEEITKEETPINLRNVERKKLKEIAKKINDILIEIPTADLTETNKLLLAAARLAGKKVGAKKNAIRSKV